MYGVIFDLMDSNKGGMVLTKVAVTLGMTAGIASIILWIILHFFNPYVDVMDMISWRQSIIALLLPAILAVAASFTSKYIFLFIAFLWALPFSFYLALTPGIFALFALTCVAYFISYIMMYWANRKSPSS